MSTSGGADTGSSATLARQLEVGRLLEGALDRPPEQWQEFLRASCEDPSIIQEVVALLEGEDDLGSLLGSPAAEVLGREGGLDLDDLVPSPGGHDLRDLAFQDDEDIPDTIGPYTVLSSLGQGGMGRVYLAEQTEPVERKVAVKLAFHVQANPEAKRRFQLERKALGRLSHPNIAHLYEAGTTPEGRPFVAMEWVDGPQILDYCNRRSLPIEARLRLFIDVCRGAQHAHQKQILHRDLKPSNILVEDVDGRPVAKIIDFGIAKALDRPVDHTYATGNRLIGTPYYMSPEAVDPNRTDDPDTRSDIYSLGVVLYELVTGLRPFRNSARDLSKLLQEILEQGAKRPSVRLAELDASSRYRLAADRNCEPEVHASLLRGDLDWIIAKAMARDRDERYSSASELADELQRVLEHRPILARPPNRFYESRKWVRRNRLAAALAAVALVASILATVLTTSALTHARRAEEQSRHEAEVSQSALEFIVELFESARPEVRDQEPTARDLLGEGVDRLRQSDLTPLARAKILHTLGDVHGRLGLYPTARDLVAESLEIRQGELGAQDIEVLASAQLLGNLERRAGNLEEAEALLAGVLDAAEAQGDTDPLGLADALNSLGNLRWAQRRLDDAREIYQRALDLRLEHLGPMAEEVGGSHNNMGVLLLSSGLYPAAEVHLRRAAEIYESQLGPRHPQLADVQGNLAIVLFNLGRLAESERMNRQALDSRQAALGPDHPLTGTSFNNLSAVLVRMGRYEDAEAASRQATEIRRRTLGENHRDTVGALSNLGTTLRHRGRYGDAESVFQRVLELRQNIYSPENINVLRSRRRLAAVWSDLGRSKEAEAELRGVLEVLEEHHGNRHADRAFVLHELAATLAGDQRLDEAEALYLASLDSRRRSLSPDEFRLAETHFALGELYRQQDRADEADAQHREALELRRQVLPEGHPDRARSEAVLGRY